jgi:hypothetical protein
MTIVFECPKGHQFSAMTFPSGLGVQCPQCSRLFKRLGPMRPIEPEDARPAKDQVERRRREGK